MGRRLDEVGIGGEVEESNGNSGSGSGGADPRSD